MNAALNAPPQGRESAVVFGCAAEHLVGVLSPPAGPGSGLGVVLVVGGPQTRVGSHRHFVQLARQLAAAGHAALRFDLRGMGDSTGTNPGFDHSSPDIAAAVDTLMAHQPGLRGVVLWGLCDAAAGVLIDRQTRPDPRVQGLCLLNPWVRSEDSLAQTHLKHWYLQRLGQADFWRKLLRGGVGLAAVKGLFNTWRRARQSPPTAPTSDQAPHAGDFRQRMLQGLQRQHGPVLVQLSGEDHTALEFAEVARSQTAWARALQRPHVQVMTLPGADHTLSHPETQALATRQTLEWLAQVQKALP